MLGCLVSIIYPKVQAFWVEYIEKGSNYAVELICSVAL